MLVFGHRGACGYLPENTMESFELAFEQGADAIEFDVVLTSDEVPIIRHDDDLTLTTDIAGKSFPSSLAHELPWSEVRSLRAIERYAHRETSKEFNGKFSIPTLQDVLENPKFAGKHLIIEIKYGPFLKSKGLDPISSTVRVIEESNWKSRGLRLTIESFDFSILSKFKRALSDPQIEFFFLSAPDTLPQGHTKLTAELIDEISLEFDGLSVAVPMLFDSDVVSLAKDRELPLYCYTARVETAQGEYQSWFQKLANSGVQGIFADQPDLMIQAVRTRP